VGDSGHSWWLAVPTGSAKFPPSNDLVASAIGSEARSPRTNSPAGGKTAESAL